MVPNLASEGHDTTCYCSDGMSITKRYFISLLSVRSCVSLNFSIAISSISNEVWAVGAAGSLSTLAEHWDGTAWTIARTPVFNSNATNPVLVGIVALSSNNIWTAGQYIVPLEGSARHTLTENWEGTSWNFVPSPDNRNSNNRLHGITVTPNGTLWSVGTTGVFTKPERTLVLCREP